MGLPVGAPDDPTDTGEFFPDGRSAYGYQRFGLPSEMALDRMLFYPLKDREDGYLPSAPATMTMWDHVPTQEELAAEKVRQDRAERRFLAEKEGENRRDRRSFRLTEGQATGNFPGAKDRAR